LLYWTMIELFSPAAGAVTGPPPDSARRTWFDQGGVLIVRPDDSTRRRFAAALKAGHNAEHHNHNDVGSYVVALDGQAPLLDGGWMVYTADNARYAKGYQFAMINSYGHSVPVVDGQLQQPGADARARIHATQFTDAVDTFAIDLTACYPDANLSSLQRTWTYDRRGDGTLTVTDQVQFKKVGTFETALIGVEDWRRDETGVLYVRSMRGDRVAALWIQIACDHPYELLAERIENPGKFEPIRVGIRLTEPVRQANVTLTIHPADAAAAEQAPSMPIIGRRLMIDVPIERGTSR
jgi:hypothetical protein